MSTRATGEDSHPGSDDVALTRSPGFWVIVRYAILFGVVLAFAALAFLGLVKGGTDLWFTLPEDPGWFDGSLWWVAVTAGAGLLVGVLRRFFRVPLKLPGTVEELKDQRVEPSTVPGAVAVSLVSLAGGASLGPEDALGKMGGGLGTWVSERRKLSEDVRATNTLSGMAAAYGGLLSSPILASILTLEIARPKAARFADTLVAGSAGGLGRVRRVLPDRRVDVRRALRAAVVQVRGLAVARGRSPRPGRRRARADHSRRDRSHDETRRSARQAHDPSPGARGDRVRARRRRAAADAVHRNRSAHDRDPTTGRRSAPAC